MGLMGVAPGGALFDEALPILFLWVISIPFSSDNKLAVLRRGCCALEHKQQAKRECVTFAEEPEPGVSNAACRAMETRSQPCSSVWAAVFGLLDGCMLATLSYWLPGPLTMMMLSHFPPPFLSFTHRPSLFQRCVPLLF